MSSEQRSVIRQRLHAFARWESVDDGGRGEIDARYCALAVVTHKRKLAVRCEGKAHQQALTWIKLD